MSENCLQQKKYQLLIMLCYQVKPADEISQHLESIGIDPYYDFDYQLETNAAFIYQLPDSRVAFLPYDHRHEGILYTDKTCLQAMLQEDRFPIENPVKDLFEGELDRIKTFHLQAEYYRNYLNETLKLTFEVITEESVEAYLKKIIGRKIRKLTKDKDLVALICLAGELFKKKKPAKWFLEKRYGMYNPWFEPNLVDSSGNIYLMSSNVLGSVKWNVTKIDLLLPSMQIEPPIKWKQYSKYSKGLIVLE